MIKRKKRIIMYMAIIVMVTIGMGKIGEIVLAENQVSVEEQNNDISVADDEESKIEIDFIFEVNGEEAKLTKYNGSDATMIVPEVFTNGDVQYTVTSIGEKAFFEYSSLTAIEFPSSLESIGNSAFEGCRNLTSIEFSNSLVSIEDKAFIYCENLTSIEFPGSLEIIGDSAFYGCEKLKSIEIPDSVKSIKSGAFGACYSLEKVKLPNSLKSIEDGTFWQCQSLKSVKFPDSLESMESGAFSGCGSLKTVATPNTLINLDSAAFGKLWEISGVRNLIFICQDIGEMKIEELVVNSIEDIINEVYNGNDLKVYRMAVEKGIEDKYDKINSYEFVGQSISLGNPTKRGVVYEGATGKIEYTGNDIEIEDYLDISTVTYEFKGDRESNDTRIQDNTLYIGEDEISTDLSIQATISTTDGVKTKTIPIHIVRAESISIKEKPTDIYYEGNEYKPDRLVITLTYADGKETDIAYSEDNPDFSFEVNEELTFETTEQVIRYKNDRLEVSHPLTVYGNRTLSGTNVQLTGKFNKSSQLNIGKVSEDSKIYEGLSDKKIIAEYDIYVTGGYDGNHFQIEFELGNELNGKKVSIRHLKHDGNIEEFEETVSEGKITIEVTELSPFIIYTEKEIVEEPEIPIVPKPDEPNKPTPDIPDEPDLETPIIKPNEPTPNIPIIGPNDLNKPIQTKPSQNQQNRVSTEDKQIILLWGVLGIMSVSAIIISVKRKLKSDSNDL